MNAGVRAVAVAATVAAVGGMSCPSFLNPDQRTKQCDAQTPASPDSRTGTAECHAMPEFGLSCEEKFVIPLAAADMVFVVDNSGSMSEELRDIKTHLNEFANQITQSGLDFRVVMVSQKGSDNFSICVPEPLAGPNCSDSARFRHVDAYVDSTDPPDVLMDHFGNFSDFMRDDARHAVVFVTDDNAVMRPDEYMSARTNRHGLEDATVHAVVGTSRSDCPDIAGDGTFYKDVAGRTGGLAFPICCADYGQLFNALAVDVAISVRRFGLSKPVTAGSSIRVSTEVDGVRTPVTTGWMFDETLRAVIFDEGALPTPGTTVVVSYGSR